MIATKYVVMTTINPPGKAAAAFARWEGWKVVVIGDRKTPEPWDCEGVTYLGVDQQREAFGELADALPENTYIRKMLGYAYAMRHGAAAIFETDDDNLPYHDATAVLESVLWDVDKLEYQRRRSGTRWVNAYRLFGVSHCWPRGFPLERIHDFAYENGQGRDARPRAITQFLVDGDPDTDAIYRLTDGRPAHFARGLRYAFDDGMFCPINSQATLWKPASFPLMFLPAGVSDRVTDILRGYIAQACLWRSGYAVGYQSPIVFQARNCHDLKKDFEDELPLYLNASRWADELLELRGVYMVDAFRSALRKLVDAGDIPSANVELYNLFLKTVGIEV